MDLPGSGSECLPADENDLLVLEVEALQEQEGRTWRGRRISFISSLKGFKGLKILRVHNKQKVRFFKT